MYEVDEQRGMKRRDEPMLTKWVFVLLFGLQAHFAASYLVPLDERSGRELGGVIRWFWPWSYGDGGLLGPDQR
jgi:hypothetical protein